MKLQIEQQWKKEDGLADNTIYAIVPDTLWQVIGWSSNQGLSTIDIKDYSIVNYLTKGQQSKEYNRHAHLINKDLSILFSWYQRHHHGEAMDD